MYFFAWENPATKPYLGSKVNRVAGRVIVNACGSVTIDVPMMRMPTYRASGSDREECELREGRCPSVIPSLWGKTTLQSTKTTLGSI